MRPPKPTPCKACGVVESHRSNLTNRGYHLDCGIAIAEHNARAIAARDPVYYRAVLLKQLLAIQMLLRSLPRVTVDESRHVA